MSEQRGFKGFWYAPGGVPLGFFVDGIPTIEGAYQGNPPVLPDPVPDEISKVQFVRAMRSLHVGDNPAQPTLWAAHGPTIEQHPDWPYVTKLPRFDPLTLAAAAVIPATPEQMDAIWRLGATL